MKGREGPRRVLIVEDELDLAGIYSKVFTARGYQVEVARSGPEAIAKVRGYEGENRPDGFLVDICLPKECGYDVIRAIRENGLFRETPIIVMTATTEANLRKAKEAGADATYRKPFNVRDVVDEMDELIDALNKDLE